MAAARRPASGGGGALAAARVGPGRVYDVREGPGRGRAVSIYRCSGHRRAAEAGPSFRGLLSDRDRSKSNVHLACSRAGSKIRPAFGQVISESPAARRATELNRGQCVAKVVLDWELYFTERKTRVEFFKL